MLWTIIITLIVCSFLSFLLWKRILATEKRAGPQTTFSNTTEAQVQDGNLTLVSSVQPEQEENEAQEARLANDLDLMLEALEHEKNLIGRHLLYRDIIAECFPKRNQDPRLREIFLNTAQAHIQEMPQIMPDLEDRFGTKPYFFTFSYYAIALTENMEFDKAMEICRLAMAYGAKDGLGVGYEQRIDRIAKQKDRMQSSQAA